MLPQLVDLNEEHYRPREEDDEHNPGHPYHAKDSDSAQFMYNPPRSDYSPSPVDNAYYYYNTNGHQHHLPRARPPLYPHLEPINTSLNPNPSADQLSPFNPSFSSGPLSAAYPYSPVSPDDHYGPSPPNTGTSTASAPVTLTLTQAPSGNPLSHLPHSLGPSPSESNSKTYSFIPLPGNAVKKRPRRRYDEIERLYQCSWPDCAKAYGTLNHLNAHVTMQKHGSKRSPNEFKELRKQWRKAKKELEQQAQQAAAASHSLAARRVASMQSLSTPGLSPLSATEIRRPHTQDHLYDLHGYATHQEHHHLRNAYPSSAPSSTAAGPLAYTHGTPESNTHPLDSSPNHYPLTLTHPHQQSQLTLMHTASIPIAHHHHHSQSHSLPHNTSDGRYPMSLPMDFPPPDHSNPSPSNGSPRQGQDGSLDVYTGRQRYPSAPSILWSSTRSTYSVPTSDPNSYVPDSNDIPTQQNALSSYPQPQRDGGNDNDALNFFTLGGMMNVNVNVDAAGNRLPADSTLLTPLRGYDQSNLLQGQAYGQQQDSGLVLGATLDGETRPSTGHASSPSGGEEGY